MKAELHSACFLSLRPPQFVSYPSLFNHHISSYMLICHLLNPSSSFQYPVKISYGLYTSESLSSVLTGLLGHFRLLISFIFFSSPFCLFLLLCLSKPTYLVLYQSTPFPNCLFCCIFMS